MKLSACHVIKGPVKDPEVSSVNMGVSVEIPPGIGITSINTGGACKAGLAVGTEAYVVIKASSVMVRVD